MGWGWCTILENLGEGGTMNVGSDYMNRDDPSHMKGVVGPFFPQSPLGHIRDNFQGLEVFLASAFMGPQSLVQDHSGGNLREIV